MVARSDLRMAFTPLATIFSASISSPESVSSRMASFGSSNAICRISLRFFSPPEEPSFTERVIKRSSTSSKIEPRIGLVQNGELWLQQRHLQNLIALLLAAGGAFVHRAGHKALVHLEQDRAPNRSRPEWRALAPATPSAESHCASSRRRRSLRSQSGS